MKTTTSAQLWREYQAAPDTHPLIANCSYAGYARGERPLPELPVVASVAEFGALSDGVTDCTAAFRAALDAAHQRGGGALSVPAGEYILSEVLHLHHSGVVLRGAGAGASVLHFTRPLLDAIGPFPCGPRQSNWSWSGGLIWVGPADTFTADGQLALKDAEQSWEMWRPDAVLAQVPGTVERGASDIPVTDSARLQPGMQVLLTWVMPVDHSLHKEICQHPLMENYDWEHTGLTTPGYPRYQWPVEITAIDGNTVTLAQPLRLAIRPEWQVQLETTGPVVHNIGVEGLTLRGHAPHEHPHNNNEGWNGIYLNRAWDCWARDIEVVSMENGIILAAVKNVTVTDTRVSGPEQVHHAFACRIHTADSIFQDFIVDGPWRVQHGINTECLSSGCVWHRGVMRRGTFDSHRAISFDIIRTDIIVANDKLCHPGGAGSAGPYLGRRASHWNVIVEGCDRPLEEQGLYVYQPENHTMSALVGIRGVPMCTQPSWAMPEGDKDVTIADDGIAPAIIDLYEEQLRLRVGEKL